MERVTVGYSSTVGLNTEQRLRKMAATLARAGYVGKRAVVTPDAWDGLSYTTGERVRLEVEKTPEGRAGVLLLVTGLGVLEVRANARIENGIYLFSDDGEAVAECYAPHVSEYDNNFRPISGPLPPLGEV